jgi:cytochrome c biogenesis factor
MLVANSSLAVVSAGRSIWFWIITIVSLLAFGYLIYVLFLKDFFAPPPQTVKP